MLRRLSRADPTPTVCGVSCSGDPAVLITVGNAVSLVAHLRHAQAQDLADRFQEQTDRTRRFAGIAV